MIREKNACHATNNCKAKQKDKIVYKNLNGPTNHVTLLFFFIAAC